MLAAALGQLAILTNPRIIEAIYGNVKCGASLRGVSRWKGEGPGLLARPQPRGDYVGYLSGLEAR